MGLSEANVEHELVALADLATIKGLEYQQATRVLGAERYEHLERGFSGSGQRLYHEYRLPRIPFTRAKDSVAVFVPRPGRPVQPRIELS